MYTKIRNGSLMIAAAKMRRGDTAYRFQMGDLIQGD